MSSFLSNILVQSFHSAREYLTPVLTISQFTEKGQLTPEEFITTGDYLVRMSPGWKWVRGDSDRAKSYFPPDKQYLMIRNINCKHRAKTIALKDESAHADIITDPDYEDLVLPSSPVESVHSIHTNEHIEDHDSDEYGDMTSTPTPPPPLCGIDSKTNVRFYELTLVYDNYYRTPRVYLRGETPDGRPLTPGEVMEDIMQDYVNKTATFESHPHNGQQYVSIHPCRHGQTMKRIIDTFASNNNGNYPEIQLYIFIFLKFISSMIPTLDYDLTMPIAA